MKKLSLSFSPCPNDTFIFDALIHQKIDTEGLEFDVFYDDIETLNHKAFKGESDITKLSTSALVRLLDQYLILNSGSAVGFGVGPLLISKKPYANLESEIEGLKIGIPGKFTTANFLLSLAYPNAKNREEFIFSGIEDALLEEKIDLGLIIHENRFTYQNRGLIKMLDLGDFWEKLTGKPIPLAGIVVKRSLGAELTQKIDRVLRRSVEFAFANPKSGLEFIRFHAQAMEEEVMYKHIELYVNKFSVNLGVDGRAAFEYFFREAQRLNFIEPFDKEIFSEEQVLSI